jgi:hypothetical protein
METPAPEAPARFRWPVLPPRLLAVAPFLDPRTWGAVAHVWAGFPLGLFWFVGMTVGFLAGVPLTIVWIGFPLLALTLGGVWVAEGLERWLAIQLLGAQVPERRAVTAVGGESLRQWAGSVVGSPALWKGMLYLFLRFPLGLAGWIFSLVSLTVSAVFVAAPWIELFGWGDIHLRYFDVDGAWELWTVAALGIVMTIATLHLHRALGWLWARLAEALLGARLPARPAVAAPLPPAAEPQPA